MTLSPEAIKTVQDQISKDCPLLADALPLLLRHKPTTLDAYFHPICTSALIGSTQTKLCCHYLCRDGNGLVRVNDLAKRLRHEVTDYSIPKSRLLQAMDQVAQSKSMVKFSQLESEAVNLFTHLKKTGEGGELLLYVLTEAILQLPQLLCKMPLKTSSSMHYHGVDGVHGTVDPVSGNLALYWGESKLHASMSTAVSECFKSIAPFLLPTGGSGTHERRDIELLRDHVDLGDPKLEEALKRYLDLDDPQHNKLQYRGVCLVGFDLAGYPDPLDPRDRSAVTSVAKDALNDWQTKIEDGVKRAMLESVVIEVFCVPFPSVEDFRQSFLKEMGLLNGKK